MPHSTDADPADNQQVAPVESPCRLLSLPNEVLLELLSNTPYYALVALRLTNRQLQGVISKNVLLAAAKRQQELLMIYEIVFEARTPMTVIEKLTRVGRCQKCWSIDHTESPRYGRVDGRPLCEDCFDLALNRAIEAHIGGGTDVWELADVARR
jgi:hypothetical protein